MPAKQQEFSEIKDDLKTAKISLRKMSKSMDGVG
jgi:hypothetical protein